MKVKARSAWETLEVPIGATGLRVVVRETPPSERQRIARECSRKELRGAEIVDVPDAEKFLRRLIGHYVADIKGATVDNLLTLAPLTVGSDEELDLPEPDGDGVLPYDPARIVWTSPDGGTAHNLAEYLWVRAPRDEFADLIELIAKRLHSVVQAKAEAEKKVLSGS